VSTYSALQSRSADYLDRTDLSSQIQQQIKQAIRHYRGHRLAFNETRSTLTATTSQEYVSPPSDLIAIDRLYITRSSYNELLIPLPVNEIIEGRRTSNATPTAYCLYGDRIELDCPASTTFSMPIYYLKELTELSANSDTNGWTTEGEDLIVFRAEKILYARVVKYSKRAGECGILEREAYNSLRLASNRRVSQGQAVPCYP